MSVFFINPLFCIVLYLSHFLWLVQISLLRRRRELEEQLGIEKTDTAERAGEVARCATRGGDGDQAAAGLEYQDVVKAFKVHHSLGAAVGFVSFAALLPFLVS